MADSTRRRAAAAVIRETKGRLPSALLRVGVGVASCCASLLSAAAQPVAAASLSITISAQPGSAFPTMPFGTQPTIAFSPATSPAGKGNTLSAQLADSAGNAIFISTIAELSAGAPCANNKCTVTVAGGATSRTFTGLSIDKAGSYRLVFNLEAGGDDTAPTPAISNSFTVATGTASHLQAQSPVAGSGRGKAFPTQLWVGLVDAGGNPIITSTDVVSLQLLDAATLGTPTNGAVVNGRTAATLSKGIATFEGLVISQNGDYVLRATSAGIPTIDIKGPKYSASSSAPDAPIFIRDRQLVIKSGPSGGKIGQPLDPLVIQLTDSSGVLQSTNESVVVHLVQPGGVDVPFTFAGGTATSATIALVAGTATISGIVIPRTTGGGVYALVVEAAATNTTNTKAQAGNVGNTAPVAGPPLLATDRQLLFTAQPGKAEVGKPLDRNTAVSLTDGTGTPIPNSSDTVTVALSGTTTAKLGGPGCAADGKSCTLTLANGAAVFANLSIDLPGSYMLAASTSAADGAGNPIAGTTSASFTVTGATPAATPAVSPTETPAVSPPLPPAARTPVVSEPEPVLTLTDEGPVADILPGEAADEGTPAEASVDESVASDVSADKESQELEASSEDQ